MILTWVINKDNHNIKERSPLIITFYGIGTWIYFLLVPIAYFIYKYGKIELFNPKKLVSFSNPLIILYQAIIYFINFFCFWCLVMG